MNTTPEINKIKHMVVVAGDYPASGHMMLVFVQQLVHAMIEHGVKITVVAPQSIIHSVAHIKPPLPKKSTGVTGNGIVYDIYRPYILSLGNYSFLKKTIRWINNYILSKLLKKIEPNILYCHFWSSVQLVTRYAKLYSPPLFVACGEGDNALEDMVKQSSLNELTSLRSLVNGVVSVSSENKRKCVAFHLTDSDRIIVLPNCVDTELFKKRDAKFLKRELNLKENDFVLAFVGGFIPRKGPDRVAEAIKLIGDPSIKSIFIGRPFSGYPFDFDCPGIVFKGMVDHERIPEYLSCADVFVLPTQKEGCSNAIVEALSMGLPVISSDGPFNDDILDVNNSIRVDPNNIQEIANAIIKLRDDKGLRDRMSATSLSRNNNYSVMGRAERIINFISLHITKESGDKDEVADN